VRAVVPHVSQAIPVIRSKVVLWGKPADPSHDYLRGPQLQCFDEPSGPGCSEPELTGGGHAWTAGTEPFLTNPVRCAAATTRLAVDSWENPDAFENAEFVSAPVDGCERLSFEPRLTVTPQSRSADTPAGLGVHLSFPQNDNPNALATPSLRDATVAFPEGVTISPPSAEGLVGCTDTQLGLGSDNPVACPDAAKIGAVEATTPLLSESLSGGVYLREQASNDPESGQMYRLALVLENANRGLLIKLPGQIRVNRLSGQITARFVDNPQLPVSEVALQLKSGSRSPLAMPRACGTYTAVATLAPWSGATAAVDRSSFTIDQNCGAANGFAPGVEAGTVNPVAGAHSSFALRVTRAAGANVSQIEAALPEGLLATLKGVPLCAEAGAAGGACPAASQVGTTTVGAGSGESPLYVPQPGKAPTALYLAGPYKGAPYSLIAKVPAQAGPFDLGTVVVRNALHVDRATAQVTAKSDPLPQVLQGIPISYRDIRVNVDRPMFTLNPTSCDPMSINSAITAAGGAVAKDSVRFQAAGCERLPFKPKLSLRLKGKTKRSGHPALTAVLTQPSGQANIDRVSVVLPRGQFIDQGRIGEVCTRPQFAQNACPPSSVLGKATAYSPLLDRPLVGPVYLRANGGERELPDMVAALRGQIDVDLVGHIDAVVNKKAETSRIRNTFAIVPDAPVSRFVLKLNAGKRALLENSQNLCRSTQRASVRMDGQNGKPYNTAPLVKNDCGRKGANR
jgi:hypothetical protein